MRLLKTLIIFMALLLSMPFALADKININTADQETLDAVLDGVGPKKAQAIIDYRTKHGAFKVIDDITKVSGIGPKTLEKNRDKITVGTESPTTPKEDTKPETQSEVAKTSSKSAESNAASNSAKEEASKTTDDK